MIRDEMKNRISRVLVNPVLKQGFKAMYKEYIELPKSYHLFEICS